MWTQLLCGGHIQNAYSVAVETSNYQQVSRVTPDDDTGLTSQNQTRETDFSTDVEGFYIAIRDETSCIVRLRKILPLKVLVLLHTLEYGQESSYKEQFQQQ